MKPTDDQLQDWQRRLSKLLSEVELAHGENPQGTYPSEIEMAVYAAHGAVCREVKARQAPRPHILTAEDWAA